MPKKTRIMTLLPFIMKARLSVKRLKFRKSKYRQNKAMLSKSLALNVLKSLGYNFGGFLAVIILWAVVFFVLRLPWRFL